MKKFFYIFCIFFCKSPFVLAMENDDLPITIEQNVPAMSAYDYQSLSPVEFDAFIKAQEEKNAIYKSETTRLKNLLLKEQKDQEKISSLKGIISSLHNTVKHIKNNLLLDATIYSEQELKNIKEIFNNYTKKFDQKKDYNSHAYIQLIEDTLGLINRTIRLAKQKNVTIDPVLMKDFFEKRTLFLNINGSLVEDIDAQDNEKPFSIVEDIDAQDNEKPFSIFAEEYQFNNIINNYKKNNIADDEFLLSSWKHFCNWKKEHVSLATQEESINSYIKMQVELIKEEKEATFYSLEPLFSNDKINLNYVHNIKDTKDPIYKNVFSKAANLILERYKDELCSLESEDQRSFYINQLLKTTWLIFFKDTRYLEDRLFITAHSIDCLLPLYNFFYNNNILDTKEVWNGYIDTNRINKEQITVSKHLIKYEKYKDICKKTINLSDTEAATIHALTRISFQGVHDKDLRDILNTITFSQNKAEYRSNLISAYQFALFFHLRAIDNSDLIKDEKGSIKPCFEDWHRAFISTPVEIKTVMLSVLLAKGNLFFLNPNILRAFNKKDNEKIQEILNEYQAMHKNNKLIWDPDFNKKKSSPEEQKKEEDPVVKKILIKKGYTPHLINYLNDAYKKHIKICKKRTISSAKFWDEAAELWYEKEQKQMPLNSSDFFNVYILLIAKTIVYPNIFTKNTSLISFEKKYQEARTTLKKLNLTDKNGDLYNLMFINWWDPLYIYKEGDTTQTFNAQKEILLKKARQLNTLQFYVGKECELESLQKESWNLLQKALRFIMQYKETYRYIGDTEPFKEPNSFFKTCADEIANAMNERDRYRIDYFKNRLF